LIGENTRQQGLEVGRTPRAGLSRINRLPAPHLLEAAHVHCGPYAAKH
jgi:hypothetical protein